MRVYHSIRSPEDKTLYVWDFEHRQLVRALGGHDDVISSVAWNSAVPGLLGSASDDHTVRIWGPGGLRAVQIPPSPPPSSSAAAST